jgi:4-amino-4-deoxy-L-arabinose transferase-like glycosyltransferase
MGAESIFMPTTDKTFPNRLTYRQIVLALLIVLLAYTLRVTVIVQRAESDIQFMPYDGSDPHTYVEQAHGILNGTFPNADAVFFFHPGPPYEFAAIFWLLGDSIPMLYLTIALLDTLTVGFLIACGWLLTKQALGGYAAGLIYALYPPAIYYSTTGVLAPEAMFLLAMLIFLTLWQREKLVWWRTPIMGILAGAMSLMRMNFLPFIGLSALWLLARPGKWRTKIAHIVLMAVVTAATISPATIHNYRASGEFIPIATLGSMELYWANNRDANGRNAEVPATEMLDLG